jgi:hypothetical protein
MMHRSRHLVCTALLLACARLASASAVNASPLVAAEDAFIDYLDAVGAVGFIESGRASRFGEHDLAGWAGRAADLRRALDRQLAATDGERLAPDDVRAVAAMRRSLESHAAAGAGGETREPACADASRHDIDGAALRAALVSCFVEHGNHLRFEDRSIDRGTALHLLHVTEEPARRKALFDAFVPLWSAIDGRGEPDSPYRRMMSQAAADARRRGSEIDAAARALGIPAAQIEGWLVRVLETWRDAIPPQPVEPWDYRYVHSAANRRLEPNVPAGTLAPVNERFHRDLGADLAGLGVVFDLEPRAGKSPLAYTDFLTRGRLVEGGWRPPVARVVGAYPEGGLFSLNELVHESGHAVHISAIRTRPAFMDWPDTLFTEAFADVASWSIYEPAWQRRYLGVSAPEPESLRALFGGVMLDVAWALFELRMLRDPQGDPNAAWTAITREYLRIAPHPEVPWWAMRVQLVSDPGYMVNYGLGALLTAELRAGTAAAIGPFDAGNPSWYGWLGERLLRFGSERDARTLMHGLLGRPVRPDALLEQVRRCAAPASQSRPGEP